MLPFEALTLVYFTALAAAAPFSPAPRDRIVRFVVYAGAGCLVVIVAALAAPHDLRAWLAHAYLVAGYWLPALLVTYEIGQPLWLETWLVRTDAAWRRFAFELPRWAAVPLELAYLLCYPAVPFAFVAVSVHGDAGAVDRFWTAVLASGYLSYGWLPWLVSRPPRAIEPPRGQQALSGVNAAILRRVSHQLNTFPSGHVAVSVAAALGVLPVWWPGGVLVAIVAAGVTIGAVIGRYHYLADVLLGLVVGLGASLVVHSLPQSLPILQYSPISLLPSPLNPPSAILLLHFSNTLQSLQ